MVYKIPQANKKKVPKASEGIKRKREAALQAEWDQLPERSSDKGVGSHFAVTEQERSKELTSTNVQALYKQKAGAFVPIPGSSKKILKANYYLTELLANLREKKDEISHLPTETPPAEVEDTVHVMSKVIQALAKAPAESTDSLDARLEVLAVTRKSLSKQQKLFLQNAFVLLDNPSEKEKIMNDIHASLKVRAIKKEDAEFKLRQELPQLRSNDPKAYAEMMAYIDKVSLNANVLEYLHEDTFKKEKIVDSNNMNPNAADVPDEIPTGRVDLSPEARRLLNLMDESTLANSTFMRDCKEINRRLGILEKDKPLSNTLNNLEKELVSIETRMRVIEIAASTGDKTTDAIKSTLAVNGDYQALKAKAEFVRGHQKSVYDVVVCQSQPREFPQITPVVKQKVGGWLIQMCNAIKSFFTRGFKSACEQKTSAVQTKSTPFLNMMSRAGSDHQPTPVVPGA